MMIFRNARALILIFLAALPSPALAQSNTTRTKIHAPDPEQDESNALLAAAQDAMSKKDYSAAVDAYHSYLTRRPDDAIAHFQLGYAFTALSRPADARTEYERAIELNPNMAEAYENLGLTLLPSDPAAAIAPLKQATELRGKDANMFWALGTAYEAAGKPSDAIEQFENASHLPGAGPNIQLSLGRALLKSGRTADAAAAFQAVLELHPSGLSEAQAHYGLAQVHLANKQAEAAASELKMYLDAQPKDAVARRELATALADLGKNPEALAELDLAGSPATEPLQTLLLRSRIYYQAKRYDDAIPVLQKAAKLAPSKPDIPARLGHVYMEKKNYADAARSLAAALQLDPNSNDILGELIAALYFNKSYAAALKEISLLEQRETLPPVALFMRAACYDKLGEAPAALDAYNKFLAVNKDQNSDMYFEASSRVRALELVLKNKKR